jgi:hypothetical protein
MTTPERVTVTPTHYPDDPKAPLPQRDKAIFEETIPELAHGAFFPCR